jgi:methyl-accepting chemotaxis protein
MFWLAVLTLVAAWAIALLFWACCLMAKEGEEAFEELNESIRKLHQVAQSVARTSGRSAELVRRRAQPIRHLLEELEDDVTQPQRR